MNASKAISSYRFKTNIEKIKTYILLSRDVAQANQSDFFLSIIQKKNGTRFLLGSDEKQGIFKGEKKKEYFLKDIYFLFDNKKVKNIEILFSSTGFIFPDKDLEFYNSKKKSKKISLLDFSQKKMKI